jgi:tRNA A37 methylthiotransferase MiaB
LIAQGHELAKAYHESMIGTVCEVLLEEREDSGLLTGYTREYVLCHVTGDAEEGALCRVHVTGADANGLTGEIVHE